MFRSLAAAGLAAMMAAPLATSVVAAPLCTDLGFAGLFAKCNSAELPPLTIASGKPLAEGPMVLESGAYYEIEMEADGSQELAIEGPEFFRAIWIDEIVINDLEVRAMALDSFEFDDEGTIELGFIAIRPGRYELRIRGAKGDSQKVQITIK